MGDATTIMVVLRQLSPLFMIVAAGMLVYCWTGFEHLGRSLLVLALLLTAPAVFDNNLWWHPESLTMLFVATTIFALYRDELRFGRWFILAAIACGLSAATKQAGFWFFLTVAVYLAWGWRRDGWTATWKRGALFAGLMALTIVITNPLLLIPAYSRQIIDTQLLQAGRIAFGWDVAMERGPLPWYRQTLRLTYGYWWVYVAALAACLWAAIADNKRRVLAVITLTFVLPMSIYLLFFVAAKPARYFLPVMLPLLAALGYEALYSWNRSRPLRTALSVALVVVMVIQIGVFLKRDIPFYTDTLTRETWSPALAFYDQLEKVYLDQLPADRSLVIYRDPYVYVAPRENAQIVMDWDLPSYELITRLNPDLILLHQHNIANFTDPTFIENYYRPDQARLNAEFYADANAGTVPGYERVLTTAFGVALVRRDAVEQ
jgi:4-amino-4-deoxy-L-arabinose transferase-like glycosyltransferase